MLGKISILKSGFQSVSEFEKNFCCSEVGPVLSEWVMMSAPIRRVDTPQLVARARFRSLVGLN